MNVIEIILIFEVGTMTSEKENVQSNIRKAYWTKRMNMMYYRYVDYMVRVLAADSKSMIDVGSSDVGLIENFNWIPKRDALDIANPYHSENVRGIKRDLFDYNPKEKYDFATCLQVLEHIPNAQKFANKLFQIADRVLISVPYKWKENSEPEHVHDPVDLKKVNDWFGREPDYHIIVEEPLFRSHKNKRLICYYHFKNEILHVNKLRDQFSSSSTTNELEQQILKSTSQSGLTQLSTHGYQSMDKLEKIERELKKLEADLNFQADQNRAINANLKKLLDVQQKSIALKSLEMNLNYHRQMLKKQLEQNKIIAEEIRKRQSQIRTVKQKYYKSKKEKEKFRRLIIDAKQRRSWRYLSFARKVMARLNNG